MMAYDRAAVVAAAPGDKRSDRLARAVRARLRKAGGAEFVAAHNLGIDYAAGRRRGEWAHRRTTLRHTRMAKGARRAQWAAILAASLRAGSLPVAYGAEVNSLDDGELLCA